MISILIATYGDPEWKETAERAYLSCLGQDVSDIVLHHDDDGTVATSRNAIAARAVGDWLCFLDADDQLAPGYVGAMERALEQQPHGGRLLLTPAVQQIRLGRPGAPFFYKECDLRTGNWLVIGTLIQKDFFFELGGFHEHPHGLEDWNLWARAVRAGAEIVRVKDAVYIAHMNRQSKHHRLARDRRAYAEAYAHAQEDAWG